MLEQQDASKPPLWLRTISFPELAVIVYGRSSDGNEAAASFRESLRTDFAVSELS